MNKAIIAQKGPYSIDVKEGKTYYWCSCGQSKKQPFCDSSHKGTAFHPVVYKATETNKKYFCGCKQTSKQPLCDESHSNL